MTDLAALLFAFTLGLVAGFTICGAILAQLSRMLVRAIGRALEPAARLAADPEPPLSTSELPPALDPVARARAARLATAQEGLLGIPEAAGELLEIPPSSRSWPRQEGIPGASSASKRPSQASNCHFCQRVRRALKLAA